MKAILSIGLIVYSTTFYAQQPSIYSLTFDLEDGSTVAKCKLSIDWTAALDTDRIPFAFQFTGDISRSIGKATVNKATVSLEPGLQVEEGFYLQLPFTIAGNTTAHIEIDFLTDTIKDIGFGYKQLTGNWMPNIPVYRNGKYWWHEKDLKKISARLTIPGNMIAATTGIVSKEEKKDRRKVLYASADDVIQYGICLSDKFMQYTTEAGDTKIISYFFTHDAKWGEKLAKMAADVISFYKTRIGFYPSKQMSILPGWNRPVGGYPISSNMFVIHRNLDEKGDNFANWITAHELGHFYWGSGYVLTDNSYPDWFGLSMGIYTDWLYSNYKKLDLSVYNFHYRYMAGHIAGYNTTILQPVEKLQQAGFDYNNVIAHGKSFVVLQMLEAVIGKEKFLEIFTELLKNYKGKTVDYALFKKKCSAKSGTDLEWFFKQWYETNDILDYKVSKSAVKEAGPSQLEVSCTVSRPGNAIMPVEVALVNKNGASIKTLPGNFSDTVINFITEKMPFEVKIDPGKKLPLLERYAGDSTTTALAVNYILNSRKDFTRAVTLMKNALQSDTLNSYYLHQYGLALRGAGNFSLALLNFEKGSKTSHSSPYVDRCLLEIGKTYDLLKIRDKALEYYQLCLSKPTVAPSAEQYLKEAFK